MVYCGETNAKRLARLYTWCNVLRNAAGKQEEFNAGKHFVLASKEAGDVAFLTAIGTPAHNIIAVDIDPDAIGAVHERYPGVKTHIGDFAEVGKRYQRGLHTAFIDLTANMTEGLADKLANFAYSNMQDNSVFTVAFSCGREKGAVQDQILDSMIEVDERVQKLAAQGKPRTELLDGREVSPNDGRIHMVIKALNAKMSHRNFTPLITAIIQWKGAMPMVALMFRIRRWPAKRSERSFARMFNQEAANWPETLQVKIQGNIPRSEIEAEVQALTDEGSITTAQAEVMMNYNIEDHMPKVKRNSLGRGDKVRFMISNGELREATVQSVAGKGAHIKLASNNRKRFARWSELFTMDAELTLVRPDKVKLKATPVPHKKPRAKTKPPPPPQPKEPEVPQDRLKSEPPNIIGVHTRLSEWLTIWRRQQGINQKDLAKAATIEAHRISLIELGRTLIDDDEILGLCVVLTKAHPEADWLTHLERLREGDRAAGVAPPRRRFKLKAPPKRRTAQAPEPAPPPQETRPSEQPGEITVKVGGVTVTGTPESIRALVGMKEESA